MTSIRARAGKESDTSSGRKLASQRVRQRRSNAHIGIAAYETLPAGKVHYTVGFGAASQLALASRRTTRHQHALGVADHPFAARTVLGVERRLQPGEPRLRDRRRDLIGKIGRRRSGPGAVDETEAAVEAHVVDEPHRLL